MAALLAITRPGEKSIVLVPGTAASPGKKVRKPGSGAATTVMLAATALALAGMPHWPAATTTRWPPGGTAGPPKGPSARRGSSSRHGVSGKKLDGPPEVATGGRQPSSMTSKSLAGMLAKAGFSTSLFQRVSYVP